MENVSWLVAVGAGLFFFYISFSLKGKSKFEHKKVCILGSIYMLISLIYILLDQIFRDVRHT